MKIETVSIDTISLDPANARNHPRRNLSAIEASLRRFGQQKPIVVDSRNVVRAGNATLQAAQSLGWTQINIVRSDLPTVEISAYAIADNRAGELAEWHHEALACFLSDETIGDVGFDPDEIERLVGESPMSADDDSPEQVPPELPETWLVVVTCADEADQAAFLKEMTEQGRSCKALLG